VLNGSIRTEETHALDGRPWRSRDQGRRGTLHVATHHEIDGTVSEHTSGFASTTHHPDGVGHLALSPAWMAWLDITIDDSTVMPA
jgi:hypothetical protein